MLEELNICNPTLRERVDKSIVGNIIKAKMKFGMGVSASKKLHKAKF
jgi:hypothetical protein